jgi:hypothetical protein
MNGDLRISDFQVCDTFLLQQILDMRRELL